MEDSLRVLALSLMNLITLRNVGRDEAARRQTWRGKNGVDKRKEEARAKVRIKEKMPVRKQLSDDFNNE